MEWLAAACGVMMFLSNSVVTRQVLECPTTQLGRTDGVGLQQVTVEGKVR